MRALVAEWALEHGHSCSMACGIILDQEWNLCSLHWQLDSIFIIFIIRAIVIVIIIIIWTLLRVFMAEIAEELGKY